MTNTNKLTLAEVEYMSWSLGICIYSYSTRRLGMVDVVFADVAQPDQARIVALNAHHFLRTEGHVVMSIKANCVDSTAPAEVVFAGEVAKLRSEQVKPREQVTLEPYERDHAVVVGQYRYAVLRRAAPRPRARFLARYADPVLRVRMILLFIRALYPSLCRAPAKKA